MELFLAVIVNFAKIFSDRQIDGKSARGGWFLAVVSEHLGVRGKGAAEIKSHQA